MKTKTLNKNKLVNEFENIHSNFNKAISQFTEEELNMIPFEGSWTAGQVAEHIIKSNKGILNQLLNGREESSDRPFDEHVALVQEIFRSKEKMKTASRLEPNKPPHDQDSLLNILKNQKEKQFETIKGKDLNSLIPDLPFPPTPEGLTRYEWLHLMLEHADRHRKQIENIYKKLQE